MCVKDDVRDTLPSVTESTYVDLLVGNDYYADIVSLQRVVTNDGLYLLQSKVGWVLSGRTDESIPSVNKDHAMLMLTSSSCRLATQVVSFSEADNILKFKPKLEELWQLETIGIKDCPVEDDNEKVLKNFNETTLFENGRYWVRWPWREDEPELPDNYMLALGRLRSNIKRMKEDPEFLRRYNEVIQDQLNKGVIEKVDAHSDEGRRIHYIPHHAVITPHKTTTKIRVVYDGSAKAKRTDKSLHECLHRGLVMLEDMIKLLLLFRTNKVALLADIEKAFLQIGLQDVDRDVTRFLWIRDLTNSVSSDNLIMFRFTKVLFGVISRPFLLAATVNLHLSRVGTENAKRAHDNLYVDNLVTAVENTEDAVKFYNEIKNIFKDISMHIREWTSNSSEFLTHAPEDDKMQSGSSIKVLGMKWDVKNDSLSIPGKSVNYIKVTKRQLLKITASVYDPLSFYSPSH